MIRSRAISGRQAKEIFAIMVGTGCKPETVVERQHWHQLSDRDTVLAIVRQVLAEHPRQVEQYHGGKHGMLEFFMGQIMRKTSGAVEPELAQSLLRSEIMDEH